MRLREELIGIQYGRLPDPFNWTPQGLLTRGTPIGRGQRRYAAPETP